MSKHNLGNLTKPLWAAFVALATLPLLACTNNHGGVSSSSAVVSSTHHSSVIKADLGAQSFDQSANQSPTVNCTPDQISDFEKPAGELLDLDREPLDKGLYLASVSQVLMEKRIDGTQDVTRLMAREVAGTKQGEIICTENIEKLASDFDMSITGLIKFDTSQNPNGDGFTARQFYVFADHNGRGVILSNPDLGSQAQNLKRFLSSGMARGQFYRLSDRGYLLRFVREREGARITLAIRLDLIPSAN